MPRHELPYSYFRRRDSGYFFYKLAGWLKYKPAGTKLEHEVLQIIQKELARKEGGVLNRIRLKRFASEFFDQGSEWVTRHHKRGRPFTSSLTQMRNGHLENHIIPAFGDRYLDDIRMHELEDWLLTLELAPQTVNHIRNTLNLVFREAKRTGLVSMNPVVDIEPLPAKFKERSAFTLEECGKLFPVEWHKLVKVWKFPLWAVMHYLMLTTGIRIGEVAALLWKHIIWEKRGILILQAIKADGSVGPPKNGKPRAAIIPERTIELLRKWQAMTPYPDYEDYLFFAKDGGTHLNVKYISSLMGPALKRAGIVRGDRVLVTHSLRHTYTTRMEKMLPETILQYMMGHQSRKMTERYTHTGPEDRLLELLSNQDVIDEAWN